MKRFLSVLMAIVLAVSVLVIAPESTQAATMSISETSRTITEKEQFRLYINHCTSKVAWGSKDKSVAKVSTKGIVTGVRAGSTTILAKVGKTTYKCKVTVIPAMSKELTALARRFSYHYSSDHYVNADKITIRSIARGSYAFGQDTINIASYDYKIVYSGYLNSGAQQTMASYYNSKRDYVGEIIDQSSPRDLTEKTEYSFSAAEVKEVEDRARLIASGRYDPDADDGLIKLNNSDLTLCVGDTYKLKVKNTTKKAKWSSSKSSVVTVSEGKITAKKPGTATIKAVVDGVTVTASVYVIKNYEKDMRQVISCVSSIKSMCEYPDEFVVTKIELGVFKNHHFSDQMESIHEYSNGEYFAKVSFSGKNAKGQPFNGYLGISHTKAGEWLADHIYEEGWFSAEGAVTICTAAQVKEVNRLMKNGKGRLLIVPKK